MKKNLYFIALFILSLFVSCTKDNDDIGGGKNDNFDGNEWEYSEIYAPEFSSISRHTYYTMLFQQEIVSFTKVVTYSDSSNGLSEIETYVSHFTYKYEKPYINILASTIVVDVWTYKDGKIVLQNGNIFTRKK